MIGAIIGDIAGSAYEFDNTFDYNFHFFGPDKSYTDDTICTVAVADAILCGKDYQDSMREWCRRYPHPMGAYGGYFVNWVICADPHPYNSYGNGSAMRVSPVAWLFDNEADVRAQAEASAAITHNHSEGIKGAVAVATAIYRMRVATVKNSDIFDGVAKDFYGDKAFENLPPKGYFDVTCQGCVPLALYIAAIASDFEDAIRRAITYGGDSDTLGAIVGSLAEARFAIQDEMVENARAYLPNEMIRVLDKFNRCRK